MKTPSRIQAKIIKLRFALFSTGLALVFTSASGDGFVKGPYLNKVGESEARIIVDVGTNDTVRSEPLAPGVRVKFGLQALDREAEFQRGNTLIQGQLIACLTGLVPDSEYAYQVEGPGDFVSRSYRFSTAPAQPRPFSFLVFADTQKVGKEHADVVAAAIRYVEEASAKPSFLIHLGDHVRLGGEDKQWNRYFANSHPLLAELCEWPVAGNHDYQKAPGDQMFRAIFDLKDSTQYLFRHAGATFIVLDTYRFDEAKLGWFVKTLESIPAGAGPIIVAMHDSVYSSGKRKPGNVRIREALQPVFEKSGVDVVLSGHEHHYERMNPINGVIYIIAGSAGAPARPLDEGNQGGDFTAHIAAHENFMVFFVDGKKMSGKAIAASGEVFDTLPEFDWSANDPKP